MKRAAAFLSVLLVSIASSARADIQRCGDIWTNRGCSVDASADSSADTISERPANQLTESERAMSKKRFVFNDLDLRRLKAAREYSFTFNVLSAQEACLSEHTSLEDCQRAVSQADEQLDKRIALALETRKIAEQTKQSDRPAQTTVTVVENNQRDVYVVRPRRFRDDDRGAHPEGGFRVQGTIGNHEGGTHWEMGTDLSGRQLAEQRSESSLGSIWKEPGNSIPKSIPKTVPVNPRRH